jgi:restriction endonuclease S subunit
MESSQTTCSIYPSALEENVMPYSTIGSIAEILVGATLRGRDATRPDPKGLYGLVRIGDISDDGQFRTTDFIRIRPNEPISEKFFLRAGDVLFPNRGTRTTALVFRLKEQRVIAGSQFYLLRIDLDRAWPEYVAWFLRSGDAARHFESHRKGSYIQTIQRRDVAHLEMPLPSLEMQRRIAEVAKLSVSELELCDRISKLKTLLLEEQLLRAAKGFDLNMPKS